LGLYGVDAVRCLKKPQPGRRFSYNFLQGILFSFGFLRGTYYEIVKCWTRFGVIQAMSIHSTGRMKNIQDVVSFPNAKYQVSKSKSMKFCVDSTKNFILVYHHAQKEEDLETF